MIWLPPGSAKSMYTSVLFPPWFFAQKPEQKIIACSHTSDLAQSFGRKVRNTVYDNLPLLGYNIKSDERAADAWSTTTNCEYYATGVGGPIAGHRADLAVIDDPTKNRQDAESETVRERNWAWFNSDLRTRLRPGGKIILVMTRWHEDDLGGRLLVNQGNTRDGGAWRVVSIPAICNSLDDMLGRSIGEYLWDNDKTYTFGLELRAIKADYEKNGATRDWSSLYQQGPRPAEGSLFKTRNLVSIDAVPVIRGMNVVRAWDLAATKQVGTKDPDWTVGLKLGRYPNGRFIIIDVIRFRGEPQDVERAIVNTAKADGYGVTIGLPQDPGQAGKAQIKNLTAMLAGYRVISSPETGPKETRAAGPASQVNVGNFDYVKSEVWNTQFVDELGVFPGGTKDDQVDALSRAFDMLVSKGPIVVSQELLDQI